MKTIRLSTHAFLLVGLDDAGRYPDITRGGSRLKFIELHGEEDALIDLATELHDRATEGADGFGHSPQEKAIARRAVESLRKQGVYPRD